MTDKPMTLREKVLDKIRDAGYDVDQEASHDCLEDICDLLDDTGAPAHMRVAKELRGEE